MQSRQTIALLGITVAIMAEDLRLLDAAMAALAVWCGGTGPITETASIRIELVHPARPRTPVSFPITVKGSRLLLGPDGIGGEADDATGFARAVVPDALLDDPRALLGDVLEPLLLFLLARRDRTPLHAAAFMLDDTAVLLSGPSGSGKSTLARAATKVGLPVLSDDTVYVQTVPDLRVWALPGAIHILPDEAPAGAFPTRQRGGKIKVALPVVPVLSPANKAKIVLLDRGSEIGLAPIEVEAARSALMQLEPGFDLLAEQTRRALDVLLAPGGTFRLTLSDDPEAAIERLVSEWGTKRGCASSM